MDASVNIMFHGLNTMNDQPMEHNINGLINPCIQLIESHQLYNNHYASMIILKAEVNIGFAGQ
jgi:hypothetical protein